MFSLWQRIVEAMHKPNMSRTVIDDFYLTVGMIALVMLLAAIAWIVVCASAFYDDWQKWGLGKTVRVWTGPIRFRWERWRRQRTERRNSSCQ